MAVSNKKGFENGIRPIHRFSEAVLDLAPGAIFDFGEDSDGVTRIEGWRTLDPPVTQPSTAAITAKIAEFDAEWTALEYRRKRLEDYIGLNQMELMTNDAENGTTTHADAIAVVKAKWPKDNSGPIE